MTFFEAPGYNFLQCENEHNPAKIKINTSTTILHTTDSRLENYWGAEGARAHFQNSGYLKSLS